MAHVLVVDDDRSIRRTLERLIEQHGHTVETAADGQEADDLVRRGGYDLVLLDLGLPRRDGLEVLDTIAQQGQFAPPVVVVSARDDMDTTVTAIQRGAYDYLIKPIDIHQLLGVVRRALDEQEVRRQLHGIEPDRSEAAAGQLLVGRSPAMREVFKTIGQVSSTPATVLVTGESGTGKELVARAIHEVSAQRQQPFVAINCAAISGGLLESELFGHARGSFTGAITDRPGRLEAAGGGTLLLDEIGELTTDLQAKLLRVLQERTFERVGESHSRKFEARVIAATHRELRSEVQSGRFREDLYYRLRVVEIHLPPLRDRMDDLPLLVERLLARVEREVGKQVRVIAPEAVDVLERHRWPGNIRELYNVLQRAVVLARGDVITPDLVALAGLDVGSDAKPSDPRRSLADMEREHIAGVLEQTGWQKKRASEILGISRPTLDRKIKAYQLKPEHES
jgi:DNA-binding NtrC family response regulator